MPSRFQIATASLWLVLSIPNALHAQFGGLFGRPPIVPEVSVEQVRELQTDQEAAEREAEALGGKKPVPSFVVVDVRSPEEYAISIVPGAITKEQFETNPQRFLHRTVIVYCTIGYRSQRYAQKLIEQGFTAKNFKGSILMWCQAELPLVTTRGKETNRVHTYSSKYRVPAKYKAIW